MTEYKGGICRCGRPKEPNNTFCGKCYWALGHNQRRALYKRFGEGYEEAYAAAAAFLDQLKATKVPRRKASAQGEL